jgi:hypothetical protein
MWGILGKWVGLKFPLPISTTLTATDFDDSYKYATMINNKLRKRCYHELTTFIMLLKALIVRSTTQKDEKPFRTRRDIDLASVRPGDVHYCLMERTSR